MRSASFSAFSQVAPSPLSSASCAASSFWVIASTWAEDSAPAFCSALATVAGVGCRCRVANED